MGPSNHNKKAAQSEQKVEELTAPSADKTQSSVEGTPVGESERGYGEAPQEPKGPTFEEMVSELKTAALLSTDGTVKVSADEGESVQEHLQRALKSLNFGGARVIGVGLPHYEAAEFFQGQAFTSQHLISEHNARLILIDVPRDEALVLNQLLTDSSAPLEDFLSKHFHKAWSSLDFLPLLTFIQEWNSSHPLDTVTVAGLQPGGIATAAEAFKLAGTENSALRESLVEFAGNMTQFCQAVSGWYGDKRDNSHVIENLTQYAAWLRSRVSAYREYMTPSMRLVDPDTIVVEHKGAFPLEKNLLQIAEDTLSLLDTAIKDLGDPNRDGAAVYETRLSLMAASVQSFAEPAREIPEDPKVVILASNQLLMKSWGNNLGGFMERLYGDGYMCVGQADPNGF